MLPACKSDRPRIIKLHMVVSQNRTQYRPHITTVLSIRIPKKVPLFGETPICALLQSHKLRILPKEKVQDKITTICEGFLKVAADSHECQSLRLLDAIACKSCNCCDVFCDYKCYDNCFL